MFCDFVIHGEFFSFYDICRGFGTSSIALVQKLLENSMFPISGGILQ